MRLYEEQQQAAVDGNEAFGKKQRARGGTGGREKSEAYTATQRNETR